MTERFQHAIRRFDETNALDPNPELVEGEDRPRELVYAHRLTDWILRLTPDPSEPLLLAARCQHLGRWQIPRGSYPMTRAGYLRWRQDLKKLHAEQSGTILREVGYNDDLVAQVQALNLKKNFPQDPDSRILEDALCLVFLQHQFAPLAAKTADDKMIGILQKTWAKMTPAAHALALRFNYTADERELLNRALASADGDSSEIGPLATED